MLRCQSAGNSISFAGPSSFWPLSCAVRCCSQLFLFLFLLSLILSLFVWSPFGCFGEGSGQQARSSSCQPLVGSGKPGCSHPPRPWYEDSLRTGEEHQLRQEQPPTNTCLVPGTRASRSSQGQRDVFHDLGGVDDCCRATPLFCFRMVSLLGRLDVRVLFIPLSLSFPLSLNCFFATKPCEGESEIKNRNLRALSCAVPFRASAVSNSGSFGHSFLCVLSCTEGSASHRTWTKKFPGIATKSGTPFQKIITFLCVLR